jgi:hypothetical protein
MLLHSSPTRLNRREEGTDLLQRGDLNRREKGTDLLQRGDLHRREEGTDLLNATVAPTGSEPIYNTGHTGTAVSRSGHPQLGAAGETAGETAGAVSRSGQPQHPQHPQFHPQHPHRSLRTHESAVSQSYIPGIG